MSAAASSTPIVAQITNKDLVPKEYIYDKFDVTRLETLVELKRRYNNLIGGLTATPTAKSIMSSRFSTARCLIDTLYQKHTPDVDLNTLKYQLMYKVGKFDKESKLADNKVSSLFLTRPIAGVPTEDTILNLSLSKANITGDTVDAFIGQANEALVEPVKGNEEAKTDDSNPSPTPIKIDNLESTLNEIISTLTSAKNFRESIVPDVYNPILTTNLMTLDDYLCDVEFNISDSNLAKYNVLFDEIKEKLHIENLDSTIEEIISTLTSAKNFRESIVPDVYNPILTTSSVTLDDYLCDVEFNLSDSNLAKYNVLFDEIKEKLSSP